MKIIIFLLLVVAFTCMPSVAQGTIVFYNHSLQDPVTGGAYSARVTLPDGTGAAGYEFTAGLLHVGSGNLRLVATAPFLTGGIFAPSVASVQGVLPGEPATVRVRVWESSAGSYENAANLGRYHGEFPTGAPDNNLVLPMLGGDLNGVLLPARLDGIRPLVLRVPEPGGMVLFGLGALLLAAARKVISFKW